MTTLSEVPTSDLILRVSGGSRDGELIPVSTPKCFLGMEPTNKAISENPQCVIFRGRQGAVIRSYADQVTVNDGASSLHWLRKGDKIKFPNSMSVEVMQLGELKDTVSSKDSVSSKKSVSTSAPQNLEVVAGSTPAVTDQVSDSRLVVLESELRSIQLQNEQSVTRFDGLDERLSMLTEKMTLLINLSENGSDVKVSQTNEASAFPATHIASPVNDSTAEDTTLAQSQTEEKFINPVASDLTSQASQPETTQDQAEEIQVPNSESDDSVAPAVAADQLVSQTVQAEEVIQSPLTPSPLEELNRIDQEIKESASEYYSYTDDSDEQILTFDAAASDASEAVPTSEAVVVEETLVPSQPATTESLIASALASASAATKDVSDAAPTPEAGTADADAAAEAKAIADALAEKESRLSEMERIFGGALTESEPEQSSPAETTPDKTTESLDSVSTTQPADGQPSQTFEDETHSQNAEVASSADYTPSNESVAQDNLPTTDLNETGVEPKSESTESDDLEASLSPMARQLLEEVKADQELEKAKASVEPEASTLAPESVELEATVEPEVEPEENLSVAEVLARMQEDGKWDGVQNEDAPVESVEPTPEPIQEEEEEPEAVVETASEAGEDDVEDYMSQLLSRMRGEEPAVAEAKPKAEKKKKEAEKKKVEKAKLEATAAPLKAEDFKPKQKAKKMKSLDAMRELANSNARTNVKVSATQKGKETAILQACIGAGAVLMSLYYFLWASKAFCDMPFLLGIVCLAAAGFIGYLHYSAKKQSQSLVSTTKPTEATPPEAKPTDETA